jgi:hypothetical protein
MKKITILWMACIGFLNASCQNRNFLSYFPDIKNDTIICTNLEKKDYFINLDKIQFPDSVALRYFFK